MTPITPYNQFDRFGGMDADSRPFLLPPQQWRLIHGLRTLYGMNQVPPKKVLFEQPGSPWQQLAFIPNRDADFGYWLGLSPSALYQLTPDVLKPLRTGMTTGDQSIRWETCMYNNNLYFVNPLNEVRFTDGSYVKGLYSDHEIRVKPNGSDLIGNGPFSGNPMWDSNPHGEKPVTGDLGSPFTWTTGSYYRIYLTARIGSLPRDSIVQYAVFFPSAGSADVPATELYLNGIVVGVYDTYIVVRATNTVAGVPNRADGYMGWVSNITPVPSGRYVQIFYDHVVVGAPTYMGETRVDDVMWSDLRDFTSWVPRIGSEADRYTCTFFQRSDSVIRGITGMQLYKTSTLAGVHETLIILTSSCVYAMSYTGLPKIVHVTPVLKDYGCGLIHSSASLDDAVVWIDVNHGEFYAYRGQGAEAFGKGVRSYFFNDLNLDSDLAQRTYAYVDRLNFEVVWTYVSKASTGMYDKAVAFNYWTKTWSVRDAVGMSSFTRVQRRAKSVGDLNGQCKDLVGPIRTLERTSDFQMLLYGDEVGRIMRDATVFDDDIISQVFYVWETGDIFWEHPQRMKEVSSMTINATAANADFATTGIFVDVSARESVDSPVVWKYVGRWLPTLVTRMLTFTPVSGKVIRYRFRIASPTTLVGFMWSGFEDNTRLSDAAR